MKLDIKQNEELEKVPVTPGDVVFVKYEKAHRPMIRVFKNAIPILLLLMVIMVMSNPVDATQLYSDSILFDGGGSASETTVEAGTTAFGGTVGEISHLYLNFDLIKTPSILTFPNTVYATGLGEILTIKADHAGINQEFTPFTATVGGVYYGSGNVGWVRTTGTTFVYKIYFESIDSVYASSLTGKLEIVLTYDHTIFTTALQSTSGGAGDQGNTCTYTYFSVHVIAQVRSTVAGNACVGTTAQTITYQFHEEYTVSVNSVVGSVSFANISVQKNGFTARLNFTNATGYSIYDVTNNVDFSTEFFILNGLDLILTDSLSGDSVTKHFFDANGDFITQITTPTPDPLTGSGILWDKTNYTIHEIGTLQYLTDGSFFDPIASYWIDIVNVNDGGGVTKFEGLGTSGSISYQFPNVGSYETYYKRCALLSCLFPETIASTVVTANKGQPSQIFPNATYKVGIPSNLSYYLNPYYEEDFYFYYWSEDAKKYIPSYGKYSTPTGYGNVSFNCGFPTTYKITLDGSVAYTKCVSDNTQAGFNISTSFLNVSSTTPKLLDYLEIEYGVDSISWVGNNSMIKTYDKNGINVFTYPVGVQYDKISFFLVYVPHEAREMVVSTGVNTIKLELEDGTVLASQSITVSEINDNGYGLILQKHDFCTNEKVAFKYYAPADVNLSLYQDDVFLKKAFLPASVNGNNTWIFISKPGTYSIRLTYNNVQYADDVITITDCTVISPTPTPSGTQQANQLVNLLTSNIFWALIVVGGLMLMIAVKTKDGMATGIIGIFAMGIFSFLGWLPLWIFFTVFIIAALFIGISIVTKQMESK